MNVSVVPEIVRMLMDGFGVDDIALKTGLNVRFIRSHVDKMRKSGALFALYKQARQDRAKTTKG